MSEAEKVTTGAEENQQGQEEEKITLTKAELEKRLQSEADKRVDEAIKTREKKWQAEHEKTLKKEREEAEKMALMSADEKQKALEKKRQEELDSREREINMRDIKLKAINKLDTDELPVSFSDFLLGESEDKTFENIDIFKKHWQDALELEIKKRLKGTTPSSGAEDKKPFDMNEILRRKMRR